MMILVIANGITIGVLNLVEAKVKIDWTKLMVVLVVVYQEGHYIAVFRTPQHQQQQQNGFLWESNQVQMRQIEIIDNDRLKPPIGIVKFLGPLNGFIKLLILLKNLIAIILIQAILLDDR